MSTKRMKVRRPAKEKITPEVLALFRKCEEIAVAGLDRTGEDGRMREYLEYIEAAKTLHRLLGRRPWQHDVTDVLSPEPPEWMTDPDERRTWHTAWALRLELEARCDAAERS